MKSTGMVRKIDELGRIVVPKEVRRTLGIDEGDPMEIYTDGEKVVLRKYRPECIFCGTITDGTISHSGKNICPDCIKQLQKQMTLDRAMAKRQ